MSKKPDGPLALIEVAIEPRSEADRERLGVALGEMAAEDLSFNVVTDHESGQTILSGVSELQLDLKIDVLKHIYGVHPNVGAPQVAYRETISRRFEVDHTYKKQIGGGGKFARVRLVFEPDEPGSGFNFEARIVGGAVPDEYIPGVEKGLEAARQNGLLAGYPVTDFKATLIDGAYHDLDSSEGAFEIAARAAFSELREWGAPKLLWPIMKVEVLTPDEFLGDFIGDLNSKRGGILGTEQRGDEQVITALVPLANMFGYVGNLRAISQGRAQFSMHYSHYEAVPRFDPDPEPPTFPPAIGMRA